MKGKVFGLIVITAIGISVMAYMGYLGHGETIQVKAQFVKFNCGDTNIDMKVMAISDSSFYYLIGKTISPELTFKQGKLDEFVSSRVKFSQTNKQEMNDFLVEGNIRKERILHCSGSPCFTVAKIKYGSEKDFTEF